MPIPEDKLADIKDCLFQGQKIQAIKIYRECTGAGLADAKAAVEHLEGDLRVASPEKFPAPTSGKGCLGVAVALFLVVTVVVTWIVVTWVVSR